MNALLRAASDKPFLSSFPLSLHRGDRPAESRIEPVEDGEGIQGVWCMGERERAGVLTKAVLTVVYVLRSVAPRVWVVVVRVPSGLVMGVVVGLLPLLMRLLLMVVEEWGKSRGPLRALLLLIAVRARGRMERQRRRRRRRRLGGEGGLVRGRRLVERMEVVLRIRGRVADRVQMGHSLGEEGRAGGGWS